MQVQLSTSGQSMDPGSRDAGCLYIVATPIGNLDDISRRALDVLTRVDLIAAEDTRHTQQLLNHYGIRQTLISLHQHNERGRVKQLGDLLTEGRSVALVSDAGTPLISDPGATLVGELRAGGFRIIPVPGVSALIAALSVCGLSTERFSFEGFLPAKGSNRRSALQKLALDQRTLVFYEAPHRIKEMIQDCADSFGSERRLFIGREMTKTFETFLSGTAAELVTVLYEDSNQSRGEFVVVVEGRTPEPANDDLLDAKIDLLPLLAVLKDKLSPSDLASALASATGLKKRDIYRQILAM